MVLGSGTMRESSMHIAMYSHSLRNSFVINRVAVSDSLAGMIVSIVSTSVNIDQHNDTVW